jgi:hypothetical protein
MQWTPGKVFEAFLAACDGKIGAALKAVGQAK